MSTVTERERTTLNGGRRRGTLARLQLFFVPDASARRAPIRTGRSKHRVKNALVGDPGPAFRVDPDGRGLAARLERSSSFDAPAADATTTEEQADHFMQAVALTFVTLGLCLIAFVASASNSNSVRRGGKAKLIRSTTLQMQVCKLRSTRTPWR